MHPGCGAALIVLCLCIATYGQSISISNPAVGQTYRVGDTMGVQWQADTAIDDVILEYSPDEGMTWVKVYDGSIRRADAQWGNYPWHIPAYVDNTPVASPNGRIRIREYNGNAEKWSDMFVIEDGDTTTNGPVLMLSPGEVQCTGDTVFTVYGSNSGTDTLPPLNAIADVQWLGVVPYGSGNNVWFETTVDTAGLADGLYLGTVTVSGNGVSGIYEVRLTKNTSGGITIFKPDTADVYTIHDTMLIDWTATSSVQEVIIEYSPDQAMTWMPVSGGTVSRTDIQWGSYSWGIPQQINNDPVASPEALIRIRDYGSTVFGLSGFFSVKSPDTTQTGPLLYLSPDYVQCYGDTSLTIYANNGGTGTLPPLSASTNENWLGVNVQGSDNYQTIYTAVDTAGLADGRYNAIVEVSGTGVYSTYEVVLRKNWTASISVSNPVADQEYALGDTLYIDWRSDTIQSVILYYSPDDGQNWRMIETNAVTDGDPHWGHYPWVIPAMLDSMPVPSHHARVKVEDYEGITWTTTGMFTIHEAPYATGKTWYIAASAPDSGDGSRQAPFNHIYPFDGLRAGDRIHIAKGVYTPDSAMELYTDSVLILGGFNDSFSSRDPLLYPTEINGRDMPDSAIMFSMFGSYIEFNGISFVAGAGGQVGLATLSDTTHHIAIQRNRFSGFATALSLRMGSRIKVRNCVSNANTQGVLCNNVDSVLIENNTFFQAKEAIILYYGTGVVCVNNIFSYSDMALREQVSGYSFVNVAYNDFYENTRDLERNGMAVDVASVYPGGNVFEPPRFMDTSQAQADFRLQRSSRCIDAGDPSTPYDKEPAPNGDRVNIGAYGGTPFAAISDRFVTPVDTVAPVNRLELYTHALDSASIQFQWDPALMQGSDATHVEIWYRIDHHPLSRDDTSAVRAGTWALQEGSMGSGAPQKRHFASGVTYYFSLFVRDSAGNWSTTTTAAQDTAFVPAGQITAGFDNHATLQLTREADMAVRVSFEPAPDTTYPFTITSVIWGHKHISVGADDSAAVRQQTMPYVDTTFLVTDIDRQGEWIFGHSLVDSAGRISKTLYDTVYIGNAAPHTILTHRIRFGAARFTLSAQDDRDSMFVYHYVCTRLADSVSLPGDSSFTGIDHDSVYDAGTDTAMSITREYYPLTNGRYRFTSWCSEIDGKRDSTPEVHTFIVANATAHTFRIHNNRWHMIGVPAHSYAATPFRDAGVISYWDESGTPRDIYSYYRPSDQISELGAGQGLWRRGTQPIRIDITAQQIADSAVTIHLHHNEYGWNQVTSPYPYPVVWPYRGASLWRWDSTHNSVIVSTDTLLPWQGYWVNVPHDTSVVLQPRPCYPSHMTLTKRVMRIASSVGTPRIRIGLHSEEGDDIYNIMGFSKRASNERDSLDEPEPPAMGSQRTLFFHHPRWKENNGRFATDIRAEQEGVTVFQVGITPGNTTAWLQLYDEPQLDVYLATPDSVMRMEPHTAYPVAPDDAVTYRTIFVASDMHGMPSIPHRFHLGGATPNPFVRRVTLRYTLPYRWSDNGAVDMSAYPVTVRVLDIQGRVVRTLLDRSQQPGTYSLQWDGSSDNGTRVSAGTYFYTVSAGRYAAVTRVVRIK